MFIFRLNMIKQCTPRVVRSQEVYYMILKGQIYAFKIMQELPKLQKLKRPYMIKQKGLKIFHKMSTYLIVNGHPLTLVLRFITVFISSFSVDTIFWIDWSTP